MREGRYTDAQETAMAMKLAQDDLMTRFPIAAAEQLWNRRRAALAALEHQKNTRHRGAHAAFRARGGLALAVGVPPGADGPSASVPATSTSGTRGVTAGGAGGGGGGGGDGGAAAAATHSTRAAL